MKQKMEALGFSLAMMLMASFIYLYIFILFVKMLGE